VTAPRIPGYRYLEHLGSGGFADVFLYEQEWPRQNVAVKVVRPDVPLNDREKVMFASEANAMARLADHPYIVSVMTAGVTGDGRPFLVMRYCPPPDLGVRVRTNPMPVADSISTGIKLASAIETAHRAGIVHRDIKPSNVLVTTYSEPALTDFGIAGGLHEVEGDPDVRISYPWSPPEMLDGRSNGSVASDVYSLGATIWHLLTGRSPFSVPQGDNTTRALTARILHTTPPPTNRRDVPPALDRLLQQCLAKQPAQRPASALELALSLQRIEAAAGLSRTPIAVEGGSAGTHVRAVEPVEEPDATRMKPPVVVSSSRPRPETAHSQQEQPPQPRRVGAAIWAVLGTAVLAAIGIILLLTVNDGDENRDPGVGTSVSVSRTPDSPAPGAPTATPELSGERTGRFVRFTWSADEVQEGDTWQWTRTDTGEGGRTERQSVRLQAPDRVCVEVRLVRGQFSSPWADECVN
jgi:serine/threonine protein kinase